MNLIDRFLAEHPFFCALLEHERHILAHYIELYRCAKKSYLVLPKELQEVLWIVVRGRLAEYSVDNSPPPAEYAEYQEIKKELPPEKILERTTNATDFDEEELERNSKENFRHQKILRYFLPGDLVNLNALTEELVAPNAIVSLEDDTQVICMTSFHLAKLAQQQPKIHQALRPLYNSEGYLISGLPMPIWQQMNEIPPPYTRDLGKQWLRRKPLLHSYNSWFNTNVVLFVLILANIWQFQKLYWQALPFFNIVLILASFLVFIWIFLQRYRHEYTLKHSLLHITERGLLGLSSRIKSYPLLNISQIELIPIPILTRLFQVGGLRLRTYHGEIAQLFPVDRVHKWLKIFKHSISEAQQLQEQIQHSNAIQQFQKWHKLQPELVKEINYRNVELEGKLQKSVKALLLQICPIFILFLIALYYSLQSELLKIYLVIPLYSLMLIMVVQLFCWLRYTWRINEDFLLRYDNFLGHRYNYKIAIRKIQDVRLEYLNIFGFGTLLIGIQDQIIRLQNLNNPQNILDEIEALRHCTENSGFSPKPTDFLTHRQLEIYHDFNRSYAP